jgi:hypothetical protein
MKSTPLAVAVIWLSVASAAAAAAAGEERTPLEARELLADIAFQVGKDFLGNEPYARTRFALAANWYADAIKLGGRSPTHYRMWGNSQMLAGDLPHAILAYREGLREYPDDEKLRDALEYARSRIVYANPDGPAALNPKPEEFHPAKQVVRGWGLVLIASASVLAWLAFARWIVTRRPALLGVFVALALFGMLVAVVWLFEWHGRQGDSNVAVLTRSEILRRGDGSNFLPRRDAPLPTGAEMTLIGTHGTWRQVELADGTIGWLPAASLALP